MSQGVTHTITMLGDSALIVDFGNEISRKINDRVMSLFHNLTEHPLPGMIEAVPAYSSLAVFFDVLKLHAENVDGVSVFEKMKKELEERINTPHETISQEDDLVNIPVCYDPMCAPDLRTVSEMTRLSADEIILAHTSKTYHVYMIGFLPGFPYLGEVDESIIVPRKASPVSVRSGSVGIAGKQTGIYPLDSPGGWHIIGQTPVKLFDVKKENPVLLKPGQQIKFHAITYDEYQNYQGRNS